MKLTTTAPVPGEDFCRLSFLSVMAATAYGGGSLSCSR